MPVVSASVIRRVACLLDMLLHPRCLICEVHMPGFSALERQANRSDEVIAMALEPSRSVTNTKRLGSVPIRKRQGTRKNDRWQSCVTKRAWGKRGLTWLLDTRTSRFRRQIIPAFAIGGW